VTPFRLGLDPLTPERLYALASDPAARLFLEPGVRDRLVAGWEALGRALEAGATVYGVNTGFGGDAAAPSALQGKDGPDGRPGEPGAPGDPHGPQGPHGALQLRLARYLDTGTGDPLRYFAARGALVARAHVLAKGYSAVRPEVVEGLMALFHARVAPWIPVRGSLGASGDLVSMAPLARLLAGESVPFLTPDDAGRDARTTLPQTSAGTPAVHPAVHPTVHPVVHPAVHPKRHPSGPLPPPIRLKGRDTLALVNGLSGAGASIAVSLVEGGHALAWALASVAASGWALGVRIEGWTPRLHEPPVGRHPGARAAADTLCRWLDGAAAMPAPPAVPIQDPYSLRCAPQALGAALDGVGFAHAQVADALETVSDNPIFLDGAPVSGGNFFGSALVQAADGLKGVLARVGDLLERQTFLLVDGYRGLPRNLTGPGAAPLSHGLKGVHQLASALAMGLQEGAIPSAPFARSAESHNQDVVSNAMNGAVALDRQLAIFTELVAAHAVLAAQAVELRGGESGGQGPGPGPGQGQGQGPGPFEGAPLRAWLEGVRQVAPFVEEDAALRPALATLADRVRSPLAPA
jgi:histidine ammonia-lyase